MPNERQILKESLSKSDLKRFWCKIDRVGKKGCWRWLNAKVQDYGIFGVGHKTFRAHRVAYALAFGEAPAGLCILHKCDNPSCCNPEHLFVGTRGDNNQDLARKGRWGKRNFPTGERHHNSKLTDAQARELIARLSRGENAKLLATDFGVSIETIYTIRNREVRAWMEESDLRCVPLERRYEHGESRYCAKLTDADVRKIREFAVASPLLSQRDIARMFNVTQSTIWGVLKGKTWKHVL